MVKPFVPQSVSSPASLSWLNRFQVCLEAECSELMGDAWKVTVDPEKQMLTLQGPERTARVAIPLHPGSHVMTPIYAAHRYADQLQLAAITRGLVEPPKGSAAADEGV